MIMKARDINQLTRYALWSVFRRNDVDPVAQQDVDATLAAIAGSAAATGGDLVIRGWYDLGGLRADAHLLVWTHAEHIETLTDAYQALRRSALGRRLTTVWSQAALHRPA